ncbi:MAG: glycosyltransferase family 39 protein, partial [Actinomycetota bacterium]|nr:glycosyltransferase family 39 protein [Actinomycetota bacterium]
MTARAPEVAVPEREPAEDTDRPAERARVLRGLRYCLWVFLGMRLGLSILGLAGIGLLPGLEPADVPGWPATPPTQGWHNLVTMWERFDALWFLRIADSWYVNGDGSAVFYPGYPLAMRLFAPLFGGRLLGAAFLVSHLATFGSMALLYFLTTSEFDEAAARRTVLLLAVFPTSYFLLAPYSESLFLFLVLLALWAARRKRWEIAGLAGIGASGTRNLGILLVLPLAVEGLQQLLETRDRRAFFRAVLWSILAAGGAVAYLVYWRILDGDFLAPMRQQANWMREGSFPLGTLLAGTREAFRYPGLYPGGYHFVDWLVVAPALVAAGWVTLRTRPLYAAYTLASLLAPLSFIFFPRPFMSLPRFLVVIFPLLWAGAVWAGRRPAGYQVVLAGSAALLG